MNRNRLVMALALAIPPVAAGAATVAPSTLPDGTYTVKVVKIIDPTHIDVLLQNGDETTLAAGRSYVNFSKVQPNDQMKLSLIGGNVMVFQDLGH